MQLAKNLACFPNPPETLTLPKQVGKHKSLVNITQSIICEILSQARVRWLEVNLHPGALTI